MRYSDKDIIKIATIKYQNGYTDAQAVSEFLSRKKLIRSLIVAPLIGLAVGLGAVAIEAHINSKNDED